MISLFNDEKFDEEARRTGEWNPMIRRFSSAINRKKLNKLVNSERKCVLEHLLKLRIDSYCSTISANMGKEWKSIAVGWRGSLKC